MKEIKGDYDETVNKILNEISSGKRIGFALINHVPIAEPDVNLEYYLAYGVDWFMVRHNKTRKEATQNLLSNIRYGAGNYDEKTADLWREKIGEFEKDDLMRYARCCATCEHSSIIENKKNYVNCSERSEIVETIQVCNKYKIDEVFASGNS